MLGVPSRCRVLFAALGTRGRACMTCFGGRSPAPASSGHPLPPSLSLLQKEFFIFFIIIFFHLLQCNSHCYVASRMCKAQLTSDRAGFYNRHPPLTWQPHPRLLREAGKDLCPLDISRGQIWSPLSCCQHSELQPRACLQRAGRERLTLFLQGSSRSSFALLTI